MHITQSLLRQNLGFYASRKWKNRRTRLIKYTAADEILKALGKEVHNPDDILFEKQFSRVDVVPRPQLRVPKNETHPLFHETPCLVYRDNNVVVNGLEQVKVLTNTVEICEGLPEVYNKLSHEEVTPEVHKMVKQCVMSAHVLDAYQKLLPRRRDPERPAWVFSRDYGITADRRNLILGTRLHQLCEALFGVNKVQSAVVKEGFIAVPFDKDDHRVLLELTIGLSIASSKALPALVGKSVGSDVALPDIYPLKSVISLQEEHWYEDKDFIFVSNDSPIKFINFAFTYYDSSKVSNEYETPVLKEQILGRTLMTAFGLAAAQARQRFGEAVKDLSQPIVLQCIQTDGRLFHFTVFQLNSLDLESQKNKNILWSLPLVPLFNVCEYVSGKPVLEGYNPDVFNRLVTFYKHLP